MTVTTAPVDLPTTSYLSALQAGDNDTVRSLLSKHRSLTASKLRGPWSYPKESELDAFRFLGAYIGAVTGLQCALLLEADDLASDILDVTFSKDIDIPFGDGNTALHLAAFLGQRLLVQGLLDRGANPRIVNGKGLSPVDVTQDPELISLIQGHS